MKLKNKILYAAIAASLSLVGFGFIAGGLSIDQVMTVFVPRINVLVTVIG